MQGDRRNLTPLDSLYFVISYTFSFRVPHLWLARAIAGTPRGRQAVPSGNPVLSFKKQAANMNCLYSSF